jgi:ribosomal-protein-alanine N-acetyltransferase
LFDCEEIGLLRVQAFVFSFNAASARVLTKAGFSFEGCLRHYHLKDGVPMDANSYSMLKREWEERKQNVA